MPLNRVKQLLPFTARVWDDPRVPFIARVFFFLAPIYLLFPYDFHPDFLPGGFSDDLSVMPLLIGIALFLIPAKVFKDAGRAAATQAVCGIICLSFGAGELSDAKATRPVGLIEGKHAIAAPSLNSPHTHYAAENRVQPGVVVGQQKLLGQINPTICPAERNEREAPLQFTTKDTILTKRGGQYQLYAAEENSVAAMATCCPKSMPPRLAGGIFIDNHIKFLSRAGHAC
jgi:uncharacterized membrane protein YkvA (DUF1232 family)